MNTNATNLYGSFHMQAEGGEIMRSYWLFEEKWLAHVFCNRVRSSNGIKAITKIVASINIAILTIWHLPPSILSPCYIQYNNENL